MAEPRTVRENANSLTSEEIAAILPHRYPFALVDPEEDEGNYSGEDEEYYEDEYSEEDFENEGESEYINENDDMYREEDYDDDDL